MLGVFAFTVYFSISNREKTWPSSNIDDNTYRQKTELAQGKIDFTSC